MTVEEIVRFLQNKPGYQKKGIDYLSGYLGVSEGKISNAKELLKSKSKVILNSGDILSTKHDPVYKLKSKYDPNNVLVIADTHLPFEKEGYLDFCLKIKDKYKCGTIIHIGDEIDNCAISQYAKDPDGFSAGSEAELAQQSILDWYKAFPDVKVCIGNHSNRMFRLAHESGIPKRFLKTYEEMWNAPRGWRWADSWDILGVHYTHGTGGSGPNAALKRAIQLRRSVVIGHIHTEATIQYNVSAIDAIWGMQVGCGVDDKAYAFHYAKDNTKKSIVSCGVVLNGELPIIELMKL